MTKTFEVGKCYIDKENGQYCYVVYNSKDYGRQDNTYNMEVYAQNGKYYSTDLLEDLDFSRYEECIVKDLQVGDKVLLRSGEVTEVYNRYMSIEEEYAKIKCKGVGSIPVAARDGQYGMYHSPHDVIAILERAKDKIKALPSGRYKLPNGDIIEVE